MSSPSTPKPTFPATRDSKRARLEENGSSDEESDTPTETRETKRIRTQAPPMPLPPPERAADKIPVEIWNEIFFYCLPNTLYITPSVNDAPLLLGRVNKRWRDISLHTPALWSSLVIYCESEGNPSNKEEDSEAITVPTPEVARTWLQRAMSTPLSIEFGRSETWIPFIGLQDPPDILDVIFGTLNQWQHVNLSIPEIDEKQLCKLIHKYGGKAPILNTFVIDSGATQEDSQASPPQLMSRALWNIAATSTALRSLSVLGVSAFIRSSVALNFHGYENLRVIDLVSQISANEAVHLLQSARNIECCSLPCVSEPKATRLVERLVLPRLKDLRLQGLLLDNVWCGSFESILANITTPALSTLYLVRVDTWPQKTLMSLIQRSSCTIKTLALLSADVHSIPRSADPNELIELFAALPSLEHIWLDIQRVSMGIGMTCREVKALDMWDKVNKNFVYCPNLQVMAFSCKQSNTFNRLFLSAFSCMIETRWKRPGNKRTLRKVIMDRRNIVDARYIKLPDTHRSIARILRLRKMGLNVEEDRSTEFDRCNVLQYDGSQQLEDWIL